MIIEGFTVKARAWYPAGQEDGGHLARVAGIEVGMLYGLTQDRLKEEIAPEVHVLV